ncbi:protein NLRC3-like [Xyrichtys novacula]|uniref:Protein NLRC3-like n=1 Tax=Xyrichtys novacula TaxID=13765 RepID=A0AAV1EZF0_XYRNO|nr:protein NLRC3-like [Xyrichtys novacula]
MDGFLKVLDSDMDQYEETEEGVSPSKTALHRERGPESPEQQQEPVSPGPEPSCVSVASVPDLRDDSSSDERFHQQGSRHPVPSCVSMRTNKSMFEPYNFEGEHHSTEQRSDVTVGLPVQLHPADLDFIFKNLGEKLHAFVGEELKKFQRVLEQDFPGRLDMERDDEELVESEGKEKRRSNRESLLKITLNFLEGMKQKELADFLQSRTTTSLCQRQLKTYVKKKFGCVEGADKAGNPTLLNQIYTDNVD